MISALPCISEMQLFALMPEQERPETAWWEVRAGQPTAVVAEAVLSAIRRYAIPAIRAALDDPGREPGSAVQWTRTFPRLDDRAPDALGIEPTAWYVQPAGTALDERLASLTSDDPLERLDAVIAIGNRAVGDRRAVAALLDRLEREPHNFTRRLIASICVLPVSGDPDVRVALSETAEADEDVEVRWAARFALLFDPQAS